MGTCFIDGNMLYGWEHALRMGTCFIDGNMLYGWEHASQDHQMRFLKVKYLHNILYTVKHALPFHIVTDFSNNNNEICAMWKQKAAQVIPIVISSTGVIPKSLS